MKDNNPPFFYSYSTFRWEVRMNEIESLAEYLRDRFIGAVCTVTAPKKEGDFWQLDIMLRNNAVNLIWKDGYGFGLSIFTDDDDEDERFDYGKDYDEHIDDIDTALQRVSEILTR